MSGSSKKRAVKKRVAKGARRGSKRRGSAKPSPRETSSQPIRFVSIQAVVALHRESLAEHGGLDGVRDQGLLESALARCVHRASYEPESSAHQLAAALAFGLARNHPFNDGNKRAALVASFLFMELNGWKMVATQSDAYEAFYALAAGTRSEEQIAEWFAANSKPSRRR